MAPNWHQSRGGSGPHLSKATPRPEARAKRDTAQAMSQENVESARRTFKAFNRAFTEGTDDLYALLDPDVEWVPVTAILEGRSYHGHEGVREWIEDMKRDWEAFEARPADFRDLGDDRVLALGSSACSGPGRRRAARLPACGLGGAVPGGEGRADAVRSPSDRRPSKPPGWRSRRRAVGYPPRVCSNFLRAAFTPLAEGGADEESAYPRGFRAPMSPKRIRHAMVRSTCCAAIAPPGGSTSAVV